MEEITHHMAYREYLTHLIDSTLLYAVKSIDMNLFDIGFYRMERRTDGSNHIAVSQEFSLHVTCALSIIRQGNKRTVYYGDCDKKRFERDISTMIGLRVFGISLGEDNSLMICFDDCSIEIVPADDGEESWRFFKIGEDSPHLVASDEWIDVQF